MSITIKSDGSVTVNTVEEAAKIMQLFNASSKKQTQTIAKPVQTKGLTGRALLKAAGFTAARAPTLKLVNFMLSHKHRVWTSPELAVRLHRSPKPLNNQLSKLARKGVFDRVGFGQYVAK